jgi:hypothetical protein
MLAKILSRLTYANVMATIAAFLALGGAAAIATNTVCGKDAIGGCVTSEDIINGEVSQVDIRDRAIHSDHLADQVVDSNHVAGGAISTLHVLDNSLVSSDIRDGTLGAEDIRDESVGSADILSNSLRHHDIRNETLGTADILNESLRTHDIRDESLTGADVASNSLTSNDINESLTGADVADNSLTRDDIEEESLGGIAHSRSLNVNPGTTGYFGSEQSLYLLSYTCPSSPSEDPGIVAIHNRSGEPAHLFWDNGGSDPEYTTMDTSATFEGQARELGDLTTLSFQSGSMGIGHPVTAVIFTVHRTDFCHVQYQATRTPVL